MSGAIRSVSLGRPDLTPLLTTISAPALICAAADDPSWTPADAASAASRLPNGAPVILPGSGHIAPLFEAASALAELLTAFWADPSTVVARQRAGPTRQQPDSQRSATGGKLRSPSNSEVADAHHAGAPQPHRSPTPVWPWIAHDGR